jgi:hypothetical protein
VAFNDIKRYRVSKTVVVEKETANFGESPSKREGIGSSGPSRRVEGYWPWLQRPVGLLVKDAIDWVEVAVAGNHTHTVQLWRPA